MNLTNLLFVLYLFDPLAQAPALYQTPNDVIMVAEGQPIRARCRVIGAPRPTFRWKTPKGLHGVQEGRISISTNQDESQLTINVRSLNDNLVTNFMDKLI